MRTALYDRYGPPDALRVGDVPIPVPGVGEVRVRVFATSINGGDLLSRSGKLRLLTGSRFPKLPGIEFTGEVAELGEATAPFAVGDPVWGSLHRSQHARGTGGAAAKYVVVPVGRSGRCPGGRTRSRSSACSREAPPGSPHCATWRGYAGTSDCS